MMRGVSEIWKLSNSGMSKILYIVRYILNFFHSVIFYLSYPHKITLEQLSAKMLTGKFYTQKMMPLSN